MDKKELNKEYWIEYYTNCIRKGINTYDDVGDRIWKETIKDTLMKEIESNTATKSAINETAKYFADQIKRHRITIDEVPDSMKKLVKEL